MYGVPGLLFNLSVWESVEALHHYVYQSDHLKMMQKRREWFGEMETPNYVLWWIPAGQLPTLEEGKQRISYLTNQGPSPAAFTFKQSFPPPSAEQLVEDLEKPALIHPVIIYDVSAAESSDPMTTL